MEDTDHTLILNQLGKLDAKIDVLSSEVQKTNIEMAKLGGMKHAIQDIKSWKEGVERVVNPEDFREMKKSLQEIKATTEDVENIEEKIKTIEKEKENNRREIDKLKTFNTKAVTVGTIIGFLFTTALVVLGWILS